MPRGGAKPGERRGGRKKGTPNKVTGDVRAMIAGALDQVGGQKYLVTQARENPQAFLTLVGKVVPKDVNVQLQGAFKMLLDGQGVKPDQSNG